MKCFHSWKRILAESGPFLVVLSFFSILSGTVLESSVQLLSVFPSLLLFLPAFIDACGDISEIFAAHVSSLLHLHISMRKERKEILLNVKATILLSIIFFLVMSAIAYGVSSFLRLPLPSPTRFFLSVVSSALIAISFSIILATLTAFFTKKHNLDPDNFEAPLLSTFSDLAGVLIFLNISAFFLLH
jgi:cation transporter-like permease